MRIQQIPTPVLGGPSNGGSVSLQPALGIGPKGDKGDQGNSVTGPQGPPGPGTGAGAWQATTAYTANQVVQAPDGSMISRNSTGTSRASFDATEEAAWTSVASKTGTVAQKALNASLVPKWQPDTAYIAGQIVAAPNGTFVQRTADGVSGSTYTGTNWATPTGLGTQISSEVNAQVPPAVSSALAADTTVKSAAASAVSTELSNAGVLYAAAAPALATNRSRDPQCKTAGTQITNYTLSHITTGLPAGFSYGLETVRTGTLSAVIGSALMGGSSHTDPLRTTVTPGETVVSSASMWSDQPTCKGRMDVLFYDDTDALLSTVTSAAYTTMTQNTWQRIIGDAMVVPVGATYMRSRFQIATTSGNTVTGAKARCSGVQVDTTSVQPYGDGTVAGWAWNGAAHASTSKKIFSSPSDFIATSQKGAASGVAPLDASSKLPEAQVPSRLAQANLDNAYATASRTSHDARRDALKRAKGGVIGTNGKPVISFRIDHGVQEWLDVIWPLFTARFLPASFGIVSDAFDTGSYEPTTYTWENLRKASTRGFEVWGHSKTHVDPASNGSSILAEVVASADAIESHDLRVHGWQQPGISSLTQPGYGVNWENEGYNWGAQYPQLVMGRYPLVEMGGNSMGTKQRWLPTGPGYDMPHYTLDDQTSAAAIAYIDDAVARGFSIELMHHPRFIVGGTVTMDVAGLTAVLDHVAALRDAGTVEVLTSSGLAFADPTTSRRMDIAVNGSFASGFTGWTAGTDLTVASDAGGSYVVFPETGTGTTKTLSQSTTGEVRALGLYGTTMVVEAEVRVTGTAGVPLRFEIRDASSVTRLDELYSQTHAVGDWRKVRYPFSLSPTTTVLTLNVVRTTGGTGGTAHLRNVKIMPL